MKRILSIGLLFFCFFPFIGINIGTDTQPFALLCAFGLLYCNHNIKISEKNFFFLSIFVITLLSIISFIAVDPFQIFKRLFSYASILLIPIAVYNTFSVTDVEYIESKAKVFIWIWFIVGAVQTFIYKGFLTFIVPLYRTGFSRGVCALASEPSFYGYMCFLFFFVSLDFKRNKVLYCILSFVQVILFAQSSIPLLYFFIFCLAIGLGWIAERNIKNIWKIIVVILLVMLITYIIQTKFANSRMGVLLNRILTDPNNLLETDESVSSRFEAITKSFSRGGLPYYIGSITLMSGFGGAFYEMGVLSVFLIYPILKSIGRKYTQKSEKIGVVLSMLICMFSAINLSSPMFAFFIGYCVLSANGDNPHLISRKESYE